MYKKTLLACTALVFSISPVNAETVAPKGQNEKVEWQLNSNWQVTGKPLDIAHSLDGKLIFILDSEHQVSVYDTKGQLQGSIPVSEGVTAIDIAPKGEALYLVDEQNSSFTSLALSFVHDIDITGSPFKGNADAPVTVAVFTDFE